ncbi:MAG: serine hydrolase domain-containing protein [Pseudomonadota bacterium]
MGNETLPTIEGRCLPRYAPLKDALLANFREAGELGAALAVYLDGEPVVDLWAGSIDNRHSAPWREDTLVNVFSTTKGMVSAMALRLVAEGKLSLARPVADYWPEFAQNGKGGIPVQWLLTHRAGLPAVRALLPDAALYDWEAMCAALAAETPWWPPGTRHGYHPITFGWLVGEVIRRVSGMRVGEFWQQAFAQPLGLDFFIGVPVAEQARIARVSKPLAEPGNLEVLGFMQKMMADPQGITARAFANPLSITTGTNTPEWRSAEIPAANGHGTARAVARFYAALAGGGTLDGVEVLPRDILKYCSEEQSAGSDAVLGIDTRFSCGWMLSQNRPNTAFGPGRRSFGHPGAGGSVGLADPDRRIGFGYVMNRMGAHILLDPRATRLIDTLYRCL